MVFPRADGSGDLKNFKNVIRELFFTSAYATFAIMKAEHEKNDNTKILQLTSTQYNNLTGDITVDDYTSIPKWQVDFGDSEEIGSYSDPEDAASAWQEGTPIADFRYRLKIRHNATFVDGENTFPTISDPFPSTIVLNQYEKTTGEPTDRVAVGIELFNRSGNKMSYDSNPETVFYNGNTPTVVVFTDGYAKVYIRTDEPSAKGAFRSNHEYRIDNGARKIGIVVRSRTLND